MISGKVRGECIFAIDDVNKRSRSKRFIVNAFICGIILVFALFLSYLFYINVSFTKKYDKDRMMIEYSDMEVSFKSSFSGRFKYVMTTYNDSSEEVGVIFISYSQTLENIMNDRDISYDSLDLTDKFHVGYKFSLENTKIPSHFKVFYTTIGFKKIAFASNDELLKIIDKSDLMYENY